MAREFGGSSAHLSGSGPSISAWPVTLSIWVFDTTWSGGGALTFGNGSATDFLMIKLQAGAGCRAWARTGNVNGGQADQGTGVNSTWHHFAGVFQSSGVISYFDGTASSEATHSISYPTTNTVWIARDGFSAYATAQLAEAAIWDVALTSNEIGVLADGFSALNVRPASLRYYLPMIRDEDRDYKGVVMTPANSPTVSSHPRVFTVPPMPIWVVGAAAGGYTLALDAGSYTMTGQNPSILANRVLTLDAGSYTMTGQAAALLANRILAADAGSYTLTGQDPSLLANRVLPLDTGSYTLTGQDATILANRLLSAASGAYTLTGLDATLTYNPAGGATYTLTLDAGSYALTGQDASLLVNRILQPDTGAYTLTGQDATILRNALLQLDTGSYTLTGQDATLLASRLLAFDAGSYTLSGKTVTFVYSGEVVGSTVGLTDAAAYLVVLSDNAAYIVALGDNLL